MSQNWFEKVFGFPEGSYQTTQQRLVHRGCDLWFCRQEEEPKATSTWTRFDLRDPDFQDNTRIKIKIYLDHYRVLTNGAETGPKNYHGQFNFLNIKKKDKYLVLTDERNKKTWLMHTPEDFVPEKKFESSRAFKNGSPPYAFEEIEA